MQGTVIYAPSTFEERGAAVAFTTPLLSQTRVRRGERERLEILIPSLSEGKGIYVVPWKVVPDMVPMTVHDRYLHDLIVKTNACSPGEIRTATLRAARCGLAGPQAVKAARQALEEDERHRTLTNFLIIIDILRAVGLDSQELFKAGLDSEEGERLTRVHMAKAATALQLEPSILYANVAELADVTSPVGLVQAPEPGRMRRRLRDVVAFRDSIAEWARETVSDAAPVAEFCADVATHTLAIGERVLSDFDKRLKPIGPLLRDWNAQMEEVRRFSGRLSWLLDGWEFVTASWREALGRETHDQAMVVNELFRVLPLVPREESVHDHAGSAQAVMSQHRRSVRAYEDWRTGTLDVDLIRRIEAVKAKAA